jgi:hypothetical protein
MGEPPVRDRLHGVEAFVLTCHSNPRILCGLGPQSCWASRRNGDVAAYKGLFDYMTHQENSRELPLPTIQRQINRLTSLLARNSVN